jgi:hypothetical protein
VIHIDHYFRNRQKAPRRRLAMSNSGGEKKDFGDHVGVRPAPDVRHAGVRPPPPPPPKTEPSPKAPPPLKEG